MGTVVDINGQLFGRDDAQISVFDHGFLFGDSVYEVVRTYGNEPYALREHLHRMQNSAAGIGLLLPLSPDGIEARVRNAVTHAAHGDSYVRIIVTRGEGPMHIDPAPCEHPSVIVIVMPFKPPATEDYETGIRIRVAVRLRNNVRAVDPNVKSGNYLNNVLAFTEARRAGDHDAVMCNAEGHLTEMTTSNVFLVTNGVYRTPAMEAGLLRGITRTQLLDLIARNGWECREEDLTPEDLTSADEVFITSTLKGVMPVTRVDGSPVGDGKPGPLTKRLHAAQKADVAAWLASLPGARGGSA
jgi:branched-chain amino acid aminotransferase